MKNLPLPYLYYTINGIIKQDKPQKVYQCFCFNHEIKERFSGIKLFIFNLIAQTIQMPV